MVKKGAKYRVGDRWYMKRDYKNLQENEGVTIVNVYKKGRKTILDVQDINNVIITGVSFRKLRKRPR